MVSNGSEFETTDNPPNLGNKLIKKKLQIGKKASRKALSNPKISVKTLTHNPPHRVPKKKIPRSSQ
jgi:hypothetical protein